MIIFGCIEILFIKIPDMDRIWWLSIVAAIMSFVYACIGVGLSIARVTRTNPHLYCIIGRLATNASARVVLEHDKT